MTPPSRSASAGSAQAPRHGPLPTYIDWLALSLEDPTSATGSYYIVAKVPGWEDPPPSDYMARRVEKEVRIFLEACERTQYGFSGGPTLGRDGHENPYEWEVRIAGPPNSPYVGYGLWLEVTFPPNFPHGPPELRFRDPLIHCHVDMVSRRVQQEAIGPWSPALTVVDYLIRVFELLQRARIADVVPANREAARMYDRDPQELQDATLAQLLQNDDRHGSDSSH